MNFYHLITIYVNNDHLKHSLIWRAVKGRSSDLKFSYYTLVLSVKYKRNDVFSNSYSHSYFCNSLTGFNHFQFNISVMFQHHWVLPNKYSCFTSLFHHCTEFKTIRRFPFCLYHINILSWNVEMLFTNYFSINSITERIYFRTNSLVP